MDIHLTLAPTLTLTLLASRTLTFNPIASPHHEQVRPVVKGDSKVFAIACASVVAKVTRDRLMLQFAKKYPQVSHASTLALTPIPTFVLTPSPAHLLSQFGFAQHKGYPTHQHKLAVFKHGACNIHRLTFAPLKNMTRQQLRVSETRWALLQQRLLEKEAKKKKKKK